MSKSSSLASGSVSGFGRWLWGEEAPIPGLATIAVAVVAMLTAWSATDSRALDFPQPTAADRLVALKHDRAVLSPGTCANCGVVESVVEVQRRGPARGVAVAAYQMRIRMSDGSVRQVEQGAAMAAGAHVLVEGNAVRPSFAVAQG